MTFEQWLVEVDMILIGLIGMGHRDIPDMLWRDQFEDEASPKDAVSTLVGDTAEEAMEACM